MLLASLLLIFINLRIPVLELDSKSMMISDFMWGQITSFISIFLIFYSIFQYKNRSKQLLLNQFSKLALSVSFFIIFFQRDDMLPANGLFLFIGPYLLLVFANFFIKKDDKLVKSADRIR